MLHIYFYLYAVLTIRTNGRSLGTFQKQRSSVNRGVLDRLLSIGEQTVITLSFENAQPEPLTPLTLQSPTFLNLTVPNVSVESMHRTARRQMLEARDVITIAVKTSNSVRTVHPVLVSSFV